MYGNSGLSQASSPQVKGHWVGCQWFWYVPISNAYCPSFSDYAIQISETTWRLFEQWCHTTENVSSNLLWIANHDLDWRSYRHTMNSFCGAQMTAGVQLDAQTAEPKIQQWVQTSTSKLPPYSTTCTQTWPPALGRRIERQSCCATKDTSTIVDD